MSPLNLCSRDAARIVIQITRRQPPNRLRRQTYQGTPLCEPNLYYCNNELRLWKGEVVEVAGRARGRRWREGGLEKGGSTLRTDPGWVNTLFNQLTRSQYIFKKHNMHNQTLIIISLIILSLFLSSTMDARSQVLIYVTQRRSTNLQ